MHRILFLLACTLLFTTMTQAQIVSPGSITRNNSPTCGGGSETVGDVCITLPEASTCNTVDIFLLFDDTASFSANATTTGDIFDSLVTTLTSDLPAVNFAFGVGRFEDFGGPGGSFGGGSRNRPFILNQALLSTSHPNFTTALMDALSPAGAAPGGGGDSPESAVEGLFQAAAGLGFNGNPDTNTSVLDSGPAGDPMTWQNPDPSGDVPNFASLVETMPHSGDLGGAGWRAESCLRLVILGTDVCSVAPFSADADIPAHIEGSGATVPSTAFACGGNARFGPVGDAENKDKNSVANAVAPVGAATVPQTIQALNDLGIRVIGLGTGAGPTSDTGPSNDESVFLSALARLTGAVDAGGTPLVFDLSGGAAAIEAALLEAIKTSVETPIDIVIAPDPELPGLTVTTEPPVQENIGPGEQACFDVTFTGDETFAGGNLGLTFLDKASNGSLGMAIPVTLRCPKCLDLVPRTLFCEVGDDGVTDSFEWTFVLRNRSADDVHHLFFVDLPDGVRIEPQHLTFSPPLRPNQPTLVTVRIEGATPGTALDFRITLHDLGIEECCAHEVHLELPACDCAQLRVDRNPRCFSHPFTFNPGPPWRYTFDLENLTDVAVEYLLLAPISPSDRSTPISPSELVIEDNVLLLDDTLNLGDRTGSISVNLSGPAARPGEEACFRLSTHDAAFRQCCSIVKCLTIPDCFFGPVHFEELGSAILTRSGDALLLSEMGSGGDDGAAADFPMSDELMLSLQDFSLGVPLPEGAAVRFAVTNPDEEGDRHSLRAWLENGQVRFSAGEGQNIQEVQILRDGEVVATADAPLTVTAIEGDWPTSYITMEDNIAGVAAPNTVRQKNLVIIGNVIGFWNEVVPLQLGQGVTVLGNEVRYRTESTVSSDGFNRGELRFRFIPAATLKNLHALPFFGTR